MGRPLQCASVVAREALVARITAEFLTHLNDSTLERWLGGPDRVAPETTTDFQVPKAQERADLIAYFKQ